MDVEKIMLTARRGGRRVDDSICFPLRGRKTDNNKLYDDTTVLFKFAPCVPAIVLVDTRL